MAPWGSRRHPRGFLDPVGSILAEYQPEGSHMDLMRTNFHDFVQNLAFFNLYICSRETVYLLYRDTRLLWLGWLACCAQPWLGLAWACLACLASNNNRPPSAAGGGFAAAVVVAGPGQGKAGPGQTKPRLGTTGKPAKPNKLDPPIN